MYRISNDPTEFAQQSARGFVLAHDRDIVAVPGGVARTRSSSKPTVAVVVGGGSGHYPAFAGYVGPGLASGAVLGNIFASPSARQVHDVAAAVDEGRGVLLVYGNYAGDVLNFDDGQERLRREGHSVDTVAVTDDISSAPIDRRQERRGVAGDVVVIKIAGAAAWRGHSLTEVEELARRANDLTATFGVAFGGCTLPGADAPLFEVPSGRMALGMGIHGEPGVRESERLPASEIAQVLVTGLLAERPDGRHGSRVVALVNGLGSTKTEELFVLWSDLHDLLTGAGIDVADVEVGEFVTSFDMAGVSLTLSWLDDELLELWRADAQAPAYRRGHAAIESRASTAPAGETERSEASLAGDETSSAARSEGGELVVRALQVVDGRVERIEEQLGRLDAIAGDGDHGIGMRRGSRAATRASTEAADRGAGAATALRRAAEAWGDESGGTSGALWGLGLASLATELSDDRVPTSADLSRGITAGVDAVRARGGASPGDKTMVDALVPFAVTFATRAHDGTATALREAAVAARAAAESTAQMTPARGRSRTHPGRSIGHPDPGAVSFAEIVSALSELTEDL